MAISPETNISLKGMDWSNRLREVCIDLRLWHKICVWQGGPEGALDWVQTQIRLFSSRHPEQQPLSHIISSIAFVEMAGPERSRLATMTSTPSVSASGRLKAV